MQRDWVRMGMMRALLTFFSSVSLPQETILGSPNKEPTSHLRCALLQPKPRNHRFDNCSNCIQRRRQYNESPPHMQMVYSKWADRLTFHCFHAHVCGASEWSHQFECRRGRAWECLAEKSDLLQGQRPWLAARSRAAADGRLSELIACCPEDVAPGTDHHWNHNTDYELSCSSSS